MPPHLRAGSRRVPGPIPTAPPPCLPDDRGRLRGQGDIGGGPGGDPGDLDLTDSSSFQRAKFWVNELQNCEEGCRIYLCGTKSDLLEEDRRKRGVDFHDVQDYADEIKAELFETSSKTGQSVDELFQKVAEDYVHFTAFQVMTEEKGIDLGQRSGAYFYSCCHH
ncbi:RAB24, member RAS oncogene family [Columba livia]|uniref:RAB24, member RAS oncogene family n=1 Tax=Columba livia TaxID=8932 RepID=A0A2I0LK03_COLLI|nr:ras-related protein Rab-24 [Columba livia]PKK17768.1 RAB24, member RAS oncogene family [Columba livia]